MTETTLPTLQGRYELLREIARGGQGITYLGRDLQADQRVAVKELAIGKVDEWKAIELFEREADALESLDHPAIPSYVDSFHVEGDDGERLFLVQEFVAGDTIKALIEDGFRVDEPQARAFVRSLLEILTYIHGLQPPVIHRDIKPSNIIQQTDGRLALVDFGAAQLINPSDTGGSTVVGTSGYMPIEQMMGRAVPATDLYALGATAVHLLSHKHPGELDVVEMELQFRNHINVSTPFADFLERLLAPHVEDRFQTAEEALSALETLDRGSAQPSGGPPAPAKRSAGELTRAPWLENQTDTPSLSDQMSQMVAAFQPRRGEYWKFVDPLYNDEPIAKPEWTDIEHHRDAEGLQISIPAMGFRGDAKKFAFGAGFAVLFVTAILTVFWLDLKPNENVMGLIFFTAIFGTIAVFLGYKILQGIYEKTELTFDGGTLLVQRELFGRHKSHLVTRESFGGVEIYADQSTGGKHGPKRPTSFALRVHSSDGNFTMAETRDQDELVWLAGQIRDYMNHG